jgi:PAS domain S-box-containing protein/putative nucleotidyltransferase with HDIG domain
MSWAESDAMGDYRLIFEGAPDAILIIDRESMKIIDANGAAVSMFGYSADELCTMSVLDVSAEPDQTRSTVIESANHIPKRRLRRKDATEFWVEISASELELGGERHRAAFIRDITHRLEVEHARESSDAKFAAAFAASPDAVNINRLSDGHYVEVNEGFTKMTGWTREEVVGLTSAELGIWALPEERDRMVSLLTANGFVDQFEASFRFKDRGVRPGAMSARVIDVDGVAHIVSVTRDISELKLANERLADINREITVALGRVVEIRDPYTHGHQERVARLSRAIAEELGLSDEEIQAVEMSALVHDVGKLAVPAEILNKPGKLSAAEFGLITAHSERGYEILYGIDFPWPMAQIVLQHHERMDGTGYPHGLAGEEILPAARILSIADVVEAMASYRPYRPALGLAAAITEIETYSHRFDPDAVAACLALNRRGDLAFLSS